MHNLFYLRALLKSGMICCNVERKVQRSKSGQTMVEYAIVMVMLVALVAVCALLLYALRGQSGRALELVASEYP